MQVITEQQTAMEGEVSGLHIYFLAIYPTKLSVVYS